MDAFGREGRMRGEDPATISWFATHPASSDRAARIREHAGNLSVGPPQPVAESALAFLSKLEGLVVGSSARNGVFNGSEFLHPGLGFVVRFPDGEEWDPINTEQAVAVLRKEPPGLVVLEVVATGDDALVVAQAFKPKAGKIDEPPFGEIVNGLPTARATGRDEGGWGRVPIRASARWIAHQGLVYRILSESTEHDYPLSAYDFDSAERSFRVLTPDDRDRIFEDRLHVAIAIKGETLAELLARTESDWDLEEAAAANGVEASATFGAGDPVKITHRERYSSEL
jgi:predicted Zn-dependent protease